ncbi:hypothetical protein PTSG_12214 [Salpingoeca rosetta]|uniref:CHCH domain-containing protein n=1 Tax=Salpingoeca rosetta (strain ATCC 50818 / BSB-021) TaxID=946362 RepID=F2U9Q4_SALR5|nr:uncharacterized protein PTSG_12214 [Salpingoeca rosetta]EGD73081.1 hypothetical protein PTSG_12214 [Salpingoeca rosetta]|eukprot:XP_004994112.1 hypothetical protein PTSG_12214 [Salpingoeca rosetta]
MNVRQSCGRTCSARAGMDKVDACDSEPLRLCLEKNNGDRSKCQKEWEAFKRACAAKGMGPIKKQ